MPTTKFRTFTSILNKAAVKGIKPHTDKSLMWFKNELKNLQTVTERKMLASKELEIVKRKIPLLGRMYMFGYDPKYKQTLPYYDRFPLIILVGKAKGGFYGLNLHYLNYRQRALFFDKLQDILLKKNKKQENLNRFMLDFTRLKDTPQLKAFAPCWKHYLTDHVRTKIMRVPYDYWEPALFLPNEAFTNATRGKVWKDSLKIINS